MAVKKFVRSDRSLDSKFDDGPDIAGLVKSAKESIEGVFCPRDEFEPLLEVTDWILMPELSHITGTPGFPCGLIVEVYGKKDCGKTTAATQALISCQRDGGIAMLIDTENKYSLKRAAAMGLDVKKLVIIKAKTIEEAFDKFIAMIKLIKSKKEYSSRKVFAAWDSLGATPCEAELNDDVKDFSMNAAKAIKGRLRKTLYYIKDTRTSLMLINQVYANTSTFGKKSTPYGGSGPEYHCAMILEFVAMNRIRPKGKKSPDDFCGISTKIEAVKNHLGQPFKTGEIQIDWRGFVTERDAEYAPVEFTAEKGEEDDVEDEDSETGKPDKRVRKSKASRDDSES